MGLLLTMMRIPESMHPVRSEQQRQLVIFNDARTIFNTHTLFVVSQLIFSHHKFPGKEKKQLIFVVSEE